MRNLRTVRVYLLFIAAAFLLSTSKADEPRKCGRHEFRCDNGNCVPISWLCDNTNDCGDRSDERECPDGDRDFVSRVNKPTRQNVNPLSSSIESAQRKLTSWFLGGKKTETGTEKWGAQLHRTAVALFLSNGTIFSAGHRTGEELTYEIAIRLLTYFASNGNKTLPTTELALYINAMTVACLNPKDFYGRNLVSELRSRVNRANYTNPFEILVLCTAGGTVTQQDVDRTSKAHDSQHRPFWIDNQAMAAMALACLSSRPDVRVDERIVRDMAQDLKKRQFRNGTVDNLRTTALVLQALHATKNIEGSFNFSAALRSIVQSQGSNGSIGSFMDSYYILPALSNKSFVDVNSDHCTRSPPSADETLAVLLKGDDFKVPVQLSVYVKQEIVLDRNWRLKMPANSSFYDAIETVKSLDTNLGVVYSVFEGKPYISSLSGLQDDLETGMYWFTYVRKQESQEVPTLIEQSPVDFMVQPNQELILWYRAAQWRDE
ncbi:uncharacterized protein CDAR_288501 [Caerostris darwini]|uniref:Uncharacterized protein n=2 Tax=Caerostris TaxID=172845 RepID=A0AAV4UT60_9ARAC|nr:uncharacterized protein CDAR_288501 [Caerostris darwini]